MHTVSTSVKAQDTQPIALPNNALGNAHSGIRFCHAPYPVIRHQCEVFHSPKSYAFMVRIGAYDLPLEPGAANKFRRTPEAARTAMGWKSKRVLPVSLEVNVETGEAHIRLPNRHPTYALNTGTFVDHEKRNFATYFAAYAHAVQQRDAVLREFDTLSHIVAHLDGESQVKLFSATKNYFPQPLVQETVILQKDREAQRLILERSEHISGPIRRSLKDATLPAIERAKKSAWLAARESRVKVGDASLETLIDTALKFLEGVTWKDVETEEAYRHDVRYIIRNLCYAFKFGDGQKLTEFVNMRDKLMTSIDRYFTHAPRIDSEQAVWYWLSATAALPADRAGEKKENFSKFIAIMEDTGKPKTDDVVPTALAHYARALALGAVEDPLAQQSMLGQIELLGMAGPGIRDMGNVLCNLIFVLLSENRNKLDPGACAQCEQLVNDISAMDIALSPEERRNVAVYWHAVLKQGPETVQERVLDDLVRLCQEPLTEQGAGELTIALLDSLLDGSISPPDSINPSLQGKVAEVCELLLQTTPSPAHQIGIEEKLKSLMTRGGIDNGFLLRIAKLVAEFPVWPIVERNNASHDGFIGMLRSSKRYRSSASYYEATIRPFIDRANELGIDIARLDAAQRQDALTAYRTTCPEYPTWRTRQRIQNTYFAWLDRNMMSAGMR